MTGPGGTGGMPTTGGSGPGAGGTAPGVGGGPPTCGAGSVCVPAPVGGALVSRSTSGTCATGWDTPIPVYGSSNLPTCANTCDCSAPQGGSCSNTVQVTRFNDNSCGNNSVLDGPSSITLGACQNVSVDRSVQADSYEVLPPAFTAGSCTPSGESTPPVEPLVSLCTLSDAPAAEGCDLDELCVPDPGALAACVTLDGDVACAAPYSDKRLVYDAFSDDRDCKCSCGGENGSCAATTIYLHGGNNCGGSNQGSQIVDGSCWNTENANLHDSYDVVGGAYVAGTCPASDISTGEVTLSEPRTICCVP